MSKTLVFIALLVSFAAGFAVHHFIGSPSKSQQENVSSTAPCQQLDQAKMDLMQISQNEYLQYTQIKDLKEKYEKADELLGKVMLLFLADVGFRMQKSEPVLQACAPGPQNSAPVQASLESAAPPNTSALAPVPAYVNDKLRNKSEVVRNLDTKEKIQQFLSDNLIENPKKEFADFNTVTPNQIRILEGIYSGTISFFDTKKPTYTVFWNLFPDKAGTGRYELRIEGEGNNSVTSGNGNFKNISTLSSDRDAFVIEACGDECYMQLYYNVPFNQFFGNYYEKKKGMRTYVRTGLINLHK